MYFGIILYIRAFLKDFKFFFDDMDHGGNVQKAVMKKDFQRRLVL